MSPPTRRRALQGAAAAFVALAGCPAAEESNTDPPTEVAPGIDTADTLSDPPSRMLRTATGPAVRRPDETTDEIDYDREKMFVTSADTAATLALDDDSDREQAARTFLEETDYDSETVYVEQSRVEACYRIVLCAVGWEAGEISTDYTRQYRDADVACEVDTAETVATLIRIPETLDPDDINSYSRSVGRGRCDTGRREREVNSR